MTRHVYTLRSLPTPVLPIPYTVRTMYHSTWFASRVLARTAGRASDDARAPLREERRARRSRASLCCVLRRCEDPCAGLRISDRRTWALVKLGAEARLARVAPVSPARRRVRESVPRGDASCRGRAAALLAASFCVASSLVVCAPCGAAKRHTYRRSTSAHVVVELGRAPPSVARCLGSQRQAGSARPGMISAIAGEPLSRSASAA